MKLLSLFLLSFFVKTCYAASLKVNLTDADGSLLPGAVVYLIAANPTSEQITEVSIMDQVNRQFKPHILPVQTNTLVRFPNSDSIKHHVYSFSQAKVFELPLYKGTETEPLKFSKAGVVELGCNVHDWMLGYIYVVDTPYFALTNEQSIAEFDLPLDKYEVKVWHPRIPESANNLKKAVNLQQDNEIKFVLSSELLPGHEQYEDGDEFSDYE